jgi:hypothetical protein
MMSVPPTVTATTYEEVTTEGVTANTKVLPPLLGEGAIEAALLDEIAKSDATPVVAPNAP